MKVTLLDRAKSDIATVYNNMSESNEDELYRDISAYHIQQAIEKSLKHMLEVRGTKYPKTHNIALLLELLQDEAAYEIIGPYADVFTVWEASVRYAGERLSVNTKMDMYLAIAERLYEYASTKTFKTGITGEFI